VGGSIKGAAGVLTRLKAHDLIDYALMVGSTGFFLITVLYVVYCRIPGFGLF